MNHQNLFLKTSQAGFSLSAVLLLSLTGCVGYVDRSPQTVYVTPAPVETVAIVQDDYVYYPGYQVYYSSNRRQYVYQEGRSWVTRAAPRGVSVNVLLSSPSVRLDFHDSPAQHHATVARQYPKNWAPPGANPGRKNQWKDGPHGENNGR